MKKIIEIASEFLDYDVFAGERTNEIMSRLKPALAKYKELQQTPITEDWLKEHGWRRDEKVFHGWSITFEVGKREFATLILVNCYNKGWYINDSPIRVNTLADLYGACELCDITLED